LFSVPLLAVGITMAGLAGCLPHTLDNRDPSAHEIGPSSPECVTRTSSRNLKTSTQHVESTYCDGETEMQVSAFDPPLDPVFDRTKVDMLDIERILVYFDEDVVVSADEGQHLNAYAGESMDITGYHVHNGVPVNPLKHVLEVLSISVSTVHIAFQDTYYGQDGLFGPDELSADHYGWYAFNVLPGEWVFLKLYGLSYVEQDNPAAEIGVLSKPVVMFDGHRLETPQGTFVFEAERQGDKLVGWTLSRE